MDTKISNDLKPEISEGLSENIAPSNDGNGGENGNTTPAAEIITPQPEIIEPVPALQKPKTEISTPKAENKGRLSITVNFPGEESEYIKAIIEARVKSGLSANPGNFIRQCVDFAVNLEKMHGKHQTGVNFATPAIERVKIKDAFFKD